VSARDVVPLVLAAGASSRMGRPKAALPFGDTTALGLVLGACSAAGLGPALVVTGAAPDAVRGAVPAGETVLLVDNPRWSSGRTTSIQAGLAALPADAQAFLLWPVDVCLPGAEVVRALLAARAREPERLAWIPSHAARRGHPALFARAVALVRALADEGQVCHVAVDDPFVLRDMDTPDDHAAFVREWERRRS
jgi:molybdenum cofactor cytidylyltransferase